MSAPLFPPFTAETARLKVQAAEDAWNSCDPDRVALAYTPDSEWRNRTEFLHGRAEIRTFLQRKWAHELDYKLKKELWRFEYEYRDAASQWWRAYGNELWEFAPNGLMQRRYASINDEAIAAADRRLC